MQYLDSAWDVNTRCSRRPTPLTYEHLRKYTALDLKYSRISTQLSLTDIQQILNEQPNLYMPTEIRFVVAQLLGLFGTGFVTLKSTENGALHIYPMGGTEDGKIDVLLAAGTNQIGKVELIAGTAEIGTLGAGTKSIGKVKVEGPGQTMLTAVINFATAATQEIIAAASGVKHKITTIVFTVAGETNLTLKKATTAISGAMDFGGTNEPRGMVSNHGNFPLECGTNQAFQITSSGAVQVSGYVLYYDEA